MELDLTTQLQPAVWGLIIALLAATTAVLAAVDPDEVDAFWSYRSLHPEWLRRLHRLRAFCEQRLARLVQITQATIERATKNLTLGNKTN